MVWTSKVSEKSQQLLERGFYGFGVQAYRHPLLFFAIGWLLTGLAMLGFLNMTYENEPTSLWIPQSSDIYENFEFIIDEFGPFDDDIVAVMYDRDDENILTPSKLDALYGIYLQSILNITSTFKGGNYQFRDLCARPYDSYPNCESEESNIFVLFGYPISPSNWETQAQIQAMLDRSAETAAYFVGNFIYNGSRPIGATHLRISLFLEGTDDEKQNDINWDWMQQFEKTWSDEADYYESNENFAITYFTDASFGPELDRIVAVDIPVVLGAFVVMLVYLSLTLGEFTCAGARPLVAVGCMFSIINALIFGLGLGSAFGISLNTIVLLIPFILLGVGVDDDIIMAEALKKTPLPDNDPEKQDIRFGNAMKHAGLSITLTSLASVVAFAVGSNVDIPGINAFCLYAALCFLGNYILQLFIFVPILIFDEKRMWAKRNFCLCCIQHENSTVQSIEMTLAYGMNQDVSNKNDAAHAHTHGRTATSPTSGTDGEEERSTLSACLEKASMDTLLIDGLAPLLALRWFRMGVFAFFACMLTLSITMFPYLSTKSDPAKLVPDDSFILDNFDALEGGWGEISFGVFDIVVENRDFSDAEAREPVRNMIKAFNNDFYSEYGSLGGNVTHWMDDFDSWVMLQSNGNLSVDMITDSDEYYYLLKQFANDSSCCKQWQDKILFDNDENPTKITATRFQVVGTFEVELIRRWNFVLDLQDTLYDTLGSKKNGFIFNIYFMYGYFASVIVSLTIENLGFAALGVFGVLSVLMDLRISVLIALMIVMIDIDLIGWMILTGTDLDTLSYSQVVMAVGLTVDYVIHVSHAIGAATPAKSKDDDYKERLSIAFHEMGVGVAKGAFTTFLGTMTLIFSQSEAFRTFFVMFCGIIVIAILHGFLLIPALLAELPFIYEDRCRCACAQGYRSPPGETKELSETSRYASRSSKSAK